MNIRLSDTAQIEFDEAYHYYKEESIRAAIAFRRLVNEKLKFISSNPTAFPVEYKNIRKCTLRRFPYIIYYRVSGINIEVFAIFHAKRSPSEWKSRLT